MLHYDDFFKTLRSNQFNKAQQYISGLFQSYKSNIERMSEVLPNSDYYQIQHFISESPWDAQQLMDEVAKETSLLFEGEENVCLYFDESAHTKKGNKSVGVGRQYSGQLGKVDNCQIAVYAALSAGTHYSLIDTRLFLPKDWTDDKKRCEKAGIPKDRRRFKTKLELALEMLEHHKKAGTRFNWVGGDGFYGHDIKFRKSVSDAGFTYMLDIHETDGVYLEQPNISIPEKTAIRGRKPILLKADKQRIKVKMIASDAQPDQWNTYKLRDAAKGPLIIEGIIKEVYTWNEKSETAQKEILVLRRNKNEGGQYEYKYSLTNADLRIHEPLILFQIQGQRYFIERAFEDAKQEAGMSQYQVRGWLAWHHHMALVMLSQLFVLTEKVAFKEECPLLSAGDVREIIVKTYAQRKDVMEIIRERHKRRQDDIDRRSRTKKIQT